MYSIHTREVFLVIILLMGRVSPHLHVAFDHSFTTNNNCDGNIVPPSYWQAIRGFIKGKKSTLVSYDKHDPSNTFIYKSYQGRTNSENASETEEQELIPVQEYDTQKVPIQQPVPEQQLTVQTSVPD